MRIAVINGTNRIGNQSRKVSRVTKLVAETLGHDVKLICLTEFTELFKGEYVLVIDGSKPKQLQDLRFMKNSDIIIFVAPSYFNNVPVSMKNFIELTKLSGIYQNKVIGLISCVNNIDSIFATESILTELFEHAHDDSLVLHKKVVINHERISFQKVEDYINYCESFCEVFID